MDFRLTVPSLSVNCWPATPQELVNEAFDKTRGQLQNLTGVIISPTQPAVDDQDKEWIRLDATGRENGRFIFGAGTWNRVNPELPSSNARRLFVGTEPQVWSYDGGDGTNPSITTPSFTTGAMWEVDHEFDGLSPMGVGTLHGSNPPVPILGNTNYGTPETTLNADQVAPHTHALQADSTLVNGDNIRIVSQGSGGRGLFIGESGTASDDMSVLPNEVPTTLAAVPILHPVRGLFFIKRTGRTHFVP